MANEAERKRWNDLSWAQVWPRREALTNLVTAPLLEALALRDGERVLDIGCGGGRTAIAAAGAVGESGAVVAVDVSEPLLALARYRAADAGAANLSFLLADAQTDPLGEGGYDAATSQFGVMFFDETARAFANIAAHLRPGGRLVFACWQPLERNPWFAGQALLAFLPPPPPPPPGRNRIGPFTLGDPAVVREVLSSAGFTEIEVRPLEMVSEASPEAIIDREQLLFMGVPPGLLEAANAAVDQHLAQFRQPDDSYRFPLALQLVSARRP